MGLKPKKPILYERLCNLSERVIQFSIPIGKEREKKIQDAINFCHLSITPKGSILFSILLTVILFLLTILLTLLHLIPAVLTIILLIVVLSLGYHLYNYPFYYATQYKIKASSEMVLAVLYMTVSMKVRANLENAVIFTASNLKGPLATDLAELIWDVFNGRYYSMEHGLDDFIKKWKMGNEEFTQAINLIKTSFFETSSERESVLDEAVRIVLEGTKNRMKHYSQDLKTSLTILNALGILLPIIGLVFFPMMTVFMPEAIKPAFIVIGYNIILPIVVFILMKSSLNRRPTTFHQPEALEKKITGFKRFINPSTIIPILIAGSLIGFGLYNILIATEVFSFALIIYSLLVTGGIALGIASHCFISAIPRLPRKNEVIEMENELHMVLFQLGYQMRRGGSIESNLDKIKNKIEELKVSKFFGLITGNIRMFGMTFQQAIFNPKNGAIYQYPSRLINAMFKAISEIAGSGSRVLSSAMISISNYLKNMREIEEYLKDMLSEVISTMRIQALLLAPLASGIVVSLAAMMMHMLISLSGWAESFQQQLGTYGPVGAVGGGIFNSIFTIDKILPVAYFQLIVGIYMIEVVTMISVFLSLIEHGEERIQRKYDLGKMLLIAVGIYTVTVILLYLILSSLIPAMWSA
ncbi:MAG: hypothetical protein ISS48_00045 [Candidatus Aenigmarchaeota archaeon]|nr:hypothetical protein [Candidatus Aenigmarchaeota archaeon]